MALNEKNYQQCSGFGRVVTIDSVAAGLPAPFSTIKQGMVLMQSESQPVRFRADGVAPTASVGHIVESATNGRSTTFVGDLSKLLFLATAAGGFINFHVFE